MSMNINAASGDLVTFRYPEAGLACDQEQGRQWLTLGGVYTVDTVDVHAFVSEGSGGDSGASVRLSPRETEVMSYLCGTLSAREIANTLFVSKRTVDFHCQHIYQKLGVKNRRQAVHVYQALRPKGSLPTKGSLTTKGILPTPVDARHREREQFSQAVQRAEVLLTRLDKEGTNIKRLLTQIRPREIKADCR